ncbi:MAG: GNAT family N-acetyltransferase [Acidobacteria bacterium]|nr:MAG: GNAT family N-acetyltransferase [Acidobacteriota bacterium]
MSSKNALVARSLSDFYPFSDLALAQRLEQAEGQSGAAFVEARAVAFPESGARWTEIAGTYAMYDGVRSPITQTFGLGVFQGITARELEQIEQFFREYGAPVFHEVSPLAGLPLAALLSERGYEPIEFSSVMYRPVGPGADLGLSLNEKIHVRPIEASEHAVWAQTAAKGWGPISEFPDLFSDLARINPHRKDSVCFLAAVEGQPIAAGALCINSGVAVLAGACTVPEARKQGAQLALLDSRLRYAAERGCDIAMMCAQPGSASQRNAERHGFRIAYTRIKWRLAG